jgi:hypothetical protein
VSLFTADDYARLHAIVFRPDYPGYRPEVVEAPNGDATARDTGKRYAHIATKYLRNPLWMPGTRKHARVMWEALLHAHNRATEVAFALACPTPSCPRTSMARCACWSTRRALAARRTLTWGC